MIIGGPLLGSINDVSELVDWPCPKGLLSDIGLCGESGRGGDTFWGSMELL